MKKKFVLSASLLFASHIPIANSAPSTIDVDLCHSSQLQLTLSNPARLTEILQSFPVPECAYLYGAAVLDPALKSEQKVLKTRLLTLLHNLFNATDQTGLQNYLSMLHAMVSRQPVTGRSEMSLNLLDAELTPFSNFLISRHLSFVYPKKPKTVNLLGFVADSVVHSSYLDLNEIVENNPVQSFVKKGSVIVVQANAELSQHRVGYWSNQTVYVSPGAWVIAPIDMSEFEGKFDDVNVLLSKWLATQVVE